MLCPGLATSRWISLEKQVCCSCPAGVTCINAASGFSFEMGALSQETNNKPGSELVKAIGAVFQVGARANLTLLISLLRPTFPILRLLVSDSQFVCILSLDH
jgi:hypothetical protein